MIIGKDHSERFMVSVYDSPVNVFSDVVQWFRRESVEPELHGVIMMWVSSVIGSHDPRLKTFSDFTLAWVPFPS